MQDEQEGGTTPCNAVVWLLTLRRHSYFLHVFHFIFQNSLDLVCHLDFIPTITHSPGVAAVHNVHIGNP